MSSNTLGKKLFHVPFDINGDELVERSSTLAQHMRALRFSDGEEVVLAGPSGRPAMVQLFWEARGGLRVTYMGEADGLPDPPNLALAMAWPRPQTLSEILPVVGNMGLQEVILLPAERSQGQWSKPSPERNSRAERLLQSGSEIGGHVVRPQLITPAHLNEWSIDAGRTWFLLTENGPPLKPIDGPAGIIVGPEGGFTDQERDRFLDAGAHSAGLGPYNLLVETAIYVALGTLFSGQIKG